MRLSFLLTMLLYRSFIPAAITLPNKISHPLGKLYLDANRQLHFYISQQPV
jgi:hypothetical protein